MPATILIVEDEADLSELMRYNLEAEGFRIVSAESGDEAVERIRDGVPDLILLDWMLPGLSGIELCRRWRSREETARMPIIMITARGEEEERVRGLATGADDYVVKPFSMPELVARIQALLRRVKPAARRPTCSRPAISNSIARATASAAPAATCIWGRPNTGCSNI